MAEPRVRPPSSETTERWLSWRRGTDWIDSRSVRPQPTPTDMPSFSRADRAAAAAVAMTCGISSWLGGVGTTTASSRP